MPRKATAPKDPIPVDSTRHKDKRKNIPTRELQDFVKDDEAAPKTLLYPRDPSLDPQLVWKGKDEQDQKPLAVPAVPVYIQEKIQPQALIEDLRKAAQAGQARQQDLFADFNGLPFQQQIDFYRHDQNWSNRFILGDSLLVMTSLAEKEGLKGKVQMIYLDPPYGINFGSNWQVSTRKRDVKDGKAEDATRQPEQVRAFRDTWKLGIHSYLAYLRDRLVLARELLTESGSLFVQIGNDNVHLVRCLMDEVLGSENFVAVIPFRKKTMPLGSKYIESINDYLVWYGRDVNALKYRPLFLDKDIEGDSHWNAVELQDGTRRKMTNKEIASHVLLAESCRPYQLIALYPVGINSSGLFEVEFRGKRYTPPQGLSWSTNRAGMTRLVLANRVEPYADGTTIRYVLFWDDYNITPITSLWADTSAPSDMTYAVQTNTKVIERCLLMTTDPGDLVLDPTCGSGTTAYVAEQWGRRWITIDTSRVALALARTRLMTARFPYYLLADSPEGVAKEAELTARTPPSFKTENDIRKGFVYKRVTHVTLKSIANNPDIKEGMSRAETDAAIARHADTEFLFDQPYEDGKRIRVTGPFTVESLSPHRVLSPDEERPESEAEGQRESGAGQFVPMILENLKKAGVQNQVKNERLVFDRLESFAGLWIHAEGEYTEKDGKSRRVAVSIGPEHGTVGKEHVKEAAKEALKGRGFDLLIVCGFAFDAYAAEAAKEFSPAQAPKGKDFAIAEREEAYGKLLVLLARMNPDLAMGDELLKKTGAGNLFMVFGEPDLEVKREADGKLSVEIRGVDVYDPTTGEVRSHTTDDIACWFIDTDYNGESFFVRQAYFTGADRPYEKLQRALRAQIDESAWAELYSTQSRPFDPPSTGKIAVKVINHYGDEVLKVYEVQSPA